MPCSRSPEGGWGWYSSMPCRFPGPHPGGEVEGDLARGVSRPTPRGEGEGDLARGVSRPTPKGGGLRGIWPGNLQAHTWGVSRPTPGGSITACTEAKNCIKMKKKTRIEKGRVPCVPLDPPITKYFEKLTKNKCEDFCHHFWSVQKYSVTKNRFTSLIFSLMGNISASERFSQKFYVHCVKYQKYF